MQTTISPRVSIIIPLYNRVNLISETLDSVVQQTFTDWEAVIVDDGSTDGSYEYVEEHARRESRIKAFRRNREPKGAPTCRNIGLEQAQGNYVIFLDSDDLLAPHCLQQRVAEMNDYPDCDFLVFPVQYFDHVVGDRQDIFFRYFHQDYLTSFLLKSHWITMSPIWRKEALVRLNGFDEQLKCMQDGELHLRALIADMKFRVLYDAPVDSYLRSSPNYARISNRVDVEKLNSKVMVQEKIRKVLIENRLLSPIRDRMIAANLLNISWSYQLQNQPQRADQLWRRTYEQGMVGMWSYYVGRSFISLRSWPLIRDSRLLSGGIKRLHQLLLPRFLLYL